MQTLEFTVEGKTQPKQSAKFYNKRNGFIGSYQPEKVINYANWVKLCFKEKYPTWDLFPVNIPLEMTIKAFLPIPVSKPKKWQEQAKEGKIKPTVKPDTDNITKNIKDALNGLAFADDRQIVIEHIEKWYGEKPRVEIKIVGDW